MKAPKPKYITQVAGRVFITDRERALVEAARPILRHIESWLEVYDMAKKAGNMKTMPADDARYYHVSSDADILRQALKPYEASK